MKVRRLITVVLLGLCGLVAGCAPAADTSAPSPAPAPGPAPESSSGAGFSVRSSAFENGAPIPPEHATESAGGRNTSIPLDWADPPAGTHAFAVEVIDVHPAAREWIHWLVVDVPASAAGLAVGASGTDMPSGSRELRNGFGTIGWGGPQPPPGTGVHEYRATVYALDSPSTASLAEFRSAIEPHALGSTSVSGTFER